MFQFNATTVINGTKDTSGKPLFSTVETGDLKKFIIKRFGSFDKECIVNIFKNSPKEGTVSELKFIVPDFTTLGTGEYRLSFRIVPKNAVLSDYQNLSTYAGKTYDFDFIVAREGEDKNLIADKIKKNLNLLLRESELDFVFESEKNSDTITFKTKSSYFNIENVVLYKYTNSCEVSCGGLIGYDIIDVLDAPENFKDGKYESTNALKGSSLTPCDPGFGTYEYLLNTVCLPTDANYCFGSQTEFMRPIAGVTYTQYVIDYYKNRGILGHAAVGQKTESLTQFSIWVAEGVLKEFDEALDKLGLEKGADKRYKEIKTTEEAQKAISHVTGPTTGKEKTIKISEEEASKSGK